MSGGFSWFPSPMIWVGRWGGGRSARQICLYFSLQKSGPKQPVPAWPNLCEHSTVTMGTQNWGLMCSKPCVTHCLKNSSHVTIPLEHVYYSINTQVLPAEITYAEVCSFSLMLTILDNVIFRLKFNKLTVVCSLQFLFHIAKSRHRWFFLTWKSALQTDFSYIWAFTTILTVSPSQQDER